MVDKSDGTAVDKEDNQRKRDKNMHKNKITNTTTISYEDRDGAKYSYTTVLTAGADKESDPDEPKFDAASPLPF